MESLLVVVAAVALALLLGRTIHHRLGFVTEVESWSMAPTLLPGQRLLTLRPGVARALRRGDLVVVDSREVGRPIVKRVVGLPGEHVVVAAAGRLRVDGHELVEPYVARSGGPAGEFVVPAGHLLLLGDNRARSSDARTWRAPYVPVSAVRGRVLRPGWSPAAGGSGRGPRRSAAAPAG